MSNYETHLEWEYRSLIDQDRGLERRVERQQYRLKVAETMLTKIEELLAVVRRYYEQVREDVRQAHADRVDVRMRLGEVEDEYFASAEAHEDWHQ